MKKEIKISASLACANFKNLEKDIKELEEGGVDFIHIDIMDGTFVPNFALDFSIIKTVQSITTIPVECHLMIEKPERYIEQLSKLKPEYIAIHEESTTHLHRVLKQIKESGCRPAIALNPATPLSIFEYILDDVEMIIIMTVNPGFAGQKLIPAMIKKIKDTKDFLIKNGRDNIEIMVDGSVSFEYIPQMLDAGATILVGGTSSIFDKRYSINEATTMMRKLIKEN